METLFIILSLIFLVFGVLQIILFFKLWGMTNDIRKVKNRLCVQSESYLMREIIKRNPDISNILFDAFHQSMEDVYSGVSNDYGEVISRYKLLYAKAGVDFPEAFADISTDSAWCLLTKLEEA